MSNITIVPVTLDDASELLKIYAPYVQETAISFEYEVPTLEEFRSRIKSIHANYPYIKAIDESGQILGYAYAHAFHERQAYAHSVETTIYLRKDVRGQGIGRLLYNALEDLLKEQGYLNMYACIADCNRVDEHLTKASASFHAKMGFSLIGTFHSCGYKFNKWYDMIWMEKMIGDHPSS